MPRERASAAEDCGMHARFGAQQASAHRGARRKSPAALVCISPTVCQGFVSAGPVLELSLAACRRRTWDMRISVLPFAAKANEGSGCSVRLRDVLHAAAFRWEPHPTKSVFC